MTSHGAHKPTNSLKKITRLPSLPERPADGHKGLFGRVLVVGGSNGMIGAPVLAATAALRCGSGLVQIAVSEMLLNLAISITPELIGIGVPAAGADKSVLEAAEKADVLVVGPGLGQSKSAANTVRKLLSLAKPAVVDADALNFLASGAKWPTWFKASAILTPHPGEMNRLQKLLDGEKVPTDDAGRIRVATHAARTFDQIIVLKGHRTVVTDGHRVYLNQTGDSSLSKAGAGDVLSGITGSLLGQKMNAFEAACAATWLHGTAGEIAGRKLGRRSVLARDVIDALPEAISQYP